MQNPVKEIQDVVRGLVEKPTLKRQAAVLQKYFTEDVEFRHFYINTGGVQDLTAIYQFAELVANYQSVEIHNIIYDSRENAMAIRMTVMVQPLYILPRVPLRLFTLLEFEDEKAQGGVTLKKIKVQRDYFERSPLLIMIPILGRIYDSNPIRYLVGSVQAATFDVLKQGFSVIFPGQFWHGLLDFLGTAHHKTV